MIRGFALLGEGSIGPGFRRDSAGDPLEMPHAPIGERQLTWDHPQAEVDPRAKSNLAGKLSRLSILVLANRFLGGDLVGNDASNVELDLRLGNGHLAGIGLWVAIS